MPVYSYGKLIGSRVVHNDRLLMFMLRNRAPTRFTADGRAAARQGSIADPAHANQLSRLKKQWHKEWEVEFRRKHTDYDYKKVTESINTNLDKMRERWLEGMTPRTRALFEAFDQAEAEDDEAKQAKWQLPAPAPREDDQGDEQ